MKRKIEDIDLGGMQLRSGKVLPSYPDRLPETLSNELETKLQNFKILFLGNLQHAAELLKVISNSYNIDARFPIRDKIEEIYDKNSAETAKLMGAAGDLAWFLVDNHQYHKIIATTIRNFDLTASTEDTDILPLIGGITENYEK